ncbi:NUDIX hydrolase [Pengzhenrongella sicca]|uniref:NUDIX domain-containing protein n=1 Tax=Pengzhenrongella sicca TaxID=2819238 RepID=A0A8A4ZCH9_9MICO|nr:NUDIX domain-containing protein [Pengzhenrongella sicca]QTE29700.1 NUDIX domain-containing protein [Pengzhenrongella sicca]
MSSSSSRSRPVQAAGALVWRVENGSLEVLLVHRPRYQDWSWPKGKLDPGESWPAAAAREVAEETGQPIVLGLPLTRLRYRLADGRAKHVHLWAARAATGADAPALAARLPVTPATTEEIDDLAWMSVEKAERSLTRSADAEPLATLVHLHAKGRLDTSVLIVARHARATSRSSWKGDETDRPLTPAGRRQADALVPVLAAFGVHEVVTSAWERCASTIDPYARAAGLTPGYSELTEAAHERSPGRVAAEVHRFLEAGRDVVMCTHRPVLPTVLDVLGQHSRRPVASALPTSDPYLRPAGLLVAHVGQTPKGARVLGVEQHRPGAAVEAS